MAISRLGVEPARLQRHWHIDHPTGQLHRGAARSGIGLHPTLRPRQLDAVDQRGAVAALGDSSTSFSHHT